MLAKEYQNYINAIHKVAGAQVQAKGKFSSGAVLKNSHTKTAAAASYAYIIASAAHKQKETAKFMNKEIAKMTFSAFKKVHKQLKKQGLAMMLPAAAVGTTLVADTPAAKSLLLRRDFITGVSAVALLAGVTLSPTQALAGDTVYWGKVKKQVTAYLKSQTGAMAKSITG